MTKYTGITVLFCTIFVSSSFAFAPNDMSLRKGISQRHDDDSQFRTTCAFNNNNINNNNINNHNKRSSSTLILNNSAPLTTSTGIFAAMNLAGFIISILTQSHIHLDLIGTGAFAIVGLFPLLGLSPSVTLNGRILASSAAMTLWGSKLAGFLFYRALILKHDARLASTLSTVPGTAVFWTISFLWGLVCSLPHTLGTMSTAPRQYTMLGLFIFIIGFTVETMADAQKWIFKGTNPGQFCNIGLWSISQHPNHFGNLVLWAGIFIINIPALIGPPNTNVWIKYRRLALALLSPIFMGLLFHGQSSGTITNAVELAKMRYGNQAGYTQYIAETPLIVPNVWKWIMGGTRA